MHRRDAHGRRIAHVMEVYWLEQTLADVPDNDEWLSSDEQDRAAHLRFLKRRNDWRLGRWTAKAALCAVADLPAGAESFRQREVGVAPDGSPFFVGSPWSLSLSHSAGRAACAIAKCPAFGCDIEQVRPLSEQFVADYFTREEQDTVALAEYPAQAVILIWSAKESVLKAVRTGLRDDTRVVCVTPETGPGLWQPLQAVYGTDTRFRGWWRSIDGFVRTVMSAVPVAPPIPLRVRGENRLTLAAQ